MAKAQLKTKTGTVIAIEGTPEEIASLIEKFDGGGNAPAPRAAKRKTSTPVKGGLAAFLSELIDQDFFKKPKELGAIKSALEEQGHYFPRTSLSPALIRVVRNKQLRRIKEKKRWAYVG